MALTDTQRMIVEQRIANEGKNLVVAYLFWFFLGFFSAHRFYLGQTGSAIIQLILNFLIIGLIWTFIDVFLIPGMRDRANVGVRQRIEAEMEAENAAF